LRSVEGTRHAAYFASLLQTLPYFARLHPELCRSAGSFQETQLYRELQQCQAELIEAGAGTTVTVQLSDTSSQSQLPLPDTTHAPHALSSIPLSAPSRPAEATRSTAHCAAAAAVSVSRFPSPSTALTQSIDDSWQRAAHSAHTGDNSFSAVKVQHDLTLSIETAAWLRLFNSCGRYQQAILTSLSLNPSTSAWLSMPPLSSEPGYRMRDEDYRLAVRHRLGQLPFDDLRGELCVGCARHNTETPSLLDDPDHAHSCDLQRGVSVKQRHDELKQVLAELARSCGYRVEVEPRFPVAVSTRYDPATGQHVHCVSKTDEHGDLLLVRGSTRQLIDVTVARPTTLTLMHGPASTGAHLQPLVAAAQAEKRKHGTYDAECSKHGWKLVPFTLESLGAKGAEATQLLKRMSAHSLDKSPAAFLEHADRMLSAALQAGNACVAIRGAADLLLHSYRAASTDGVHRGPGRRQLRRAASAQSADAAATNGFGCIVHADYCSARIGTRRVTAAA
jgi:hypothetical protein